jgi:hypothetical protein
LKPRSTEIFGLSPAGADPGKSLAGFGFGFYGGAPERRPNAAVINPKIYRGHGHQTANLLRGM